VVEAYWVGNDLLDRVPAGDLARHVEDRFRGRIGRSWQRVLDAVGAGAVPHHTFHVFAVYPWLGLMRTGIVDQPLHVLDQCRTTPALVESTSEDSARVIVRPLVWDGRRLALGSWTPRTVRRRDDGYAFVTHLRQGEWVSLHWDFVCDLLTPDAARRLDRVTRTVLGSVNASSATAAALG